MSSSSSSSSEPPSRQNPSSTVWIGNINSKASEYQVLKLAETVGKVIHFDFMYETSPAGQKVPRGYAFVTYGNYAVADEAIRKLNGQLLCGRSVVVQPSTSSFVSRADANTSLPKSLSMSLSSPSSGSLSTEEKIRAMEAKIKSLQGRDSQDFVVVVPTDRKTTTTGISKQRPKPKPYDPPAGSRR